MYSMFIYTVFGRAVQYLCSKPALGVVFLGDEQFDCIVDQFAAVGP